MSLLIPHNFPPSLPKLLSKSLLESATISNPSLPSSPPITNLKFPSFSSKVKTLIPSSSTSSSSFTFDFADDEDGNVVADDELYEDSPWEGAVIYKRNASVTHAEYCTTLERLGLGEFSTGVSKSRASAMGIRLPARRGKEVAEAGGDGTPVLVSVDVARRRRRLKLDGIVRTVLTLACNRCAEPAAKCIFSNFSLLLTEDPIEDPDDEINMGVIYGEDKFKSSKSSRTEDEEDDEKEIDPDDRLYFPSEEKEIDISKHIRDIVHLEITIDEICNSSCKGLCLKCGANLNKRRCNCSKEEVEDDGEYGPLKNLRKQMQQR